MNGNFRLPSTVPVRGFLRVLHRVIILLNQNKIQEETLPSVAFAIISTPATPGGSPGPTTTRRPVAPAPEGVLLGDGGDDVHHQHRVHGDHGGDAAA
jgi:hypothetical protein